MVEVTSSTYVDIIEVYFITNPNLPPNDRLRWLISFIFPRACSDFYCGQFIMIKYI